MRGGEQDSMEWRFRWRRDIFDWEAEMLRHLICEIRTATFPNEGRDCTVWPADLSNCYSVKSTYSILSKAPNFGSQTIVNKVWNKFVPLKVSEFAWQVIQNKFPSKENLVKRVFAVQHCYEALLRGFGARRHTLFHNEFSSARNLDDLKPERRARDPWLRWQQEQN
ncbi:uncharacterized protein LOC131596431 [Vicia villosa]|uniref:uncharacterized protein LOC131596431 n=1 Tax=Vicia villosa TaxID=3911 RepID=UPI00273BD9EE|nr:uncharacterized protein LOC131596431 [Vicia villosa]